MSFTNLQHVVSLVHRRMCIGLDFMESQLSSFFDHYIQISFATRGQLSLLATDDR